MRQKHAFHARISASLSRLDASFICLAACAVPTGAIRLPRLILGASIACFIFLIISLIPLANQTAPSPSLSPEDIDEISPFVVTAEPDEGYRAANTLAGSRMNAPLIQAPAAISVLTKELLDDLSFVNTEQYLTFAVNADAVFTDATGLSVQHQDVTIKICGGTGAQATRDYFPWAQGRRIYTTSSGWT